MVQSILRTLSTSVRGLHQAAYLLALFTLGAQILGLIRDRIFAHEFGAGATLDLYYAAFRIPDLVFAIVASLVSAYVLIPLIAGATKEETERLLSHTASFLLIFGGLASLALWFLLPQILPLAFPFFVAHEAYPEFVSLTGLLLLQPILLGLSGILTSVTQVHRRFILFALSPIVYNVGIIAGALFLYPTFGLVGIGAGVVIGALLHLLIHVPFVGSVGALPRLVSPSPKLIWTVVKDSVPRSLALGLGAVTTLLLTSLASRTGEGAVSIFTFASNLEMVPLALIGASYATAAFPVLSNEAREKNHERFCTTLLAAARHLVFWSSLSLVMIIVLRSHLVRTLLGTGAFDWDATRLTAALLSILVVGLAAQGFVLLASRAFYAMRRSVMPLLIQAFGLIASVGGAYGALWISHREPMFLAFFETLLRVDGAAGTEVLFIAMGAVAGQLLMGILALATLHTVAKGVASQLVQPFFEGIGAGMVGGFVAYLALSVMGNIAPLTTLLAVFTQGLVAGMVGLTVSAIILHLLQNREFKELTAALGRLNKKAVPPSGSSVAEESVP